MSQTILAIFEHGVLRPLEPLALPECAQVELTIHNDAEPDWLDRDALELADREGDATISLAEVRRLTAGSSGAWSDQVIADRGEF